MIARLLREADDESQIPSRASGLTAWGYARSRSSKAAACALNSVMRTMAFVFSTLPEPSGALALISDRAESATDTTSEATSSTCEYASAAILSDIDFRDGGSDDLCRFVSGSLSV